VRRLLPARVNGPLVRHEDGTRAVFGCVHGIANSNLDLDEALRVWNIYFNYHRPHAAAHGQPPHHDLP
jgi:hypothetical protein